jgi:hypothetical protein
MVANVDMVGRQCLLVLGMCDRRKEEVFLIHLSQSRGKTSCRRRCAWEVCIGWEVIWARSGLV